MYSPTRCKKPSYLCGRQTTPCQGSRYRPENGNLRKKGGPIAIVPCLHQGNIHINRKLQIWRDQKCIPLVGSRTLLTCAGRQTTPSQGSRYRPGNGNLRKLEWTYCHGTVLAPKQYRYQKEDKRMERLEIYSSSRCKNPTYLCGLSNYPVSRESV